MGTGTLKLAAFSFQTVLSDRRVDFYMYINKQLEERLPFNKVSVN